MSQQTKTRSTTVEGPSTTTSTKTTYRSSSDGRSQPTYHSGQKGRTTIIQRSAVGNPRSGGGSVVRSTQYGSYNSMPPISAAAYASVANMGVTAVKEGRHQEKKDMQDLNERLASYVEKVRFLEAQNRKLADELDKLKSKWGKETSAVKAMYQTELDEARRLLDECEKGKSEAELRANTMEEVVNEFEIKFETLTNELGDERDKVASYHQQISDYEAEINLLRRRNEGLQEEKDRDSKTIARLNEVVKTLRIDLDSETLNHIDADNRRQTKEEEIEFLKEVHEQEMKELAALTYRDTTSENREFWKNEMGQCLREIQVTYDDKLTTMRTEVENFYTAKLQEFRTGATRSNMETTNAKEESKKMRSVLNDLRSKVSDLEAQNANLQAQMRDMKLRYEDELHDLNGDMAKLKQDNVSYQAQLEAMMSEMQDLIDSKLGLELEIAAYRKLLEGEENRIGLSQVVSSMMSSSSSYGQSQSQGQMQDDDDSSHRVSQVVKGEMQAKTTYQRSAKGGTSILECSSDGATITIENVGRREENLSGWCLKRIVDGAEKVDWKFEPGCVMRLGMKRKICSAKFEGVMGDNDIDTGLPEFFMGANITTKLLNGNKEEKATHVQKTTYLS